MKFAVRIDPEKYLYRHCIIWDTFNLSNCDKIAIATKQVDIHKLTMKKNDKLNQTCV